MISQIDIIRLPFLLIGRGNPGLLARFTLAHSLIFLDLPFIGVVGLDPVIQIHDGRKAVLHQLAVLLND